ncbi:MAG: CHAT domain-containing protein, partial [Spirulinaceae cyanobacterium]
LLIVGDGILQSIPFAALPTANSQPLLANHEIITLPSASSLAALRKQVKGRPLAPKKLAVLADPVYESGEERDYENPRGDETRQALESCLSLAQLQFTRTEAENILALVPESQSFAALGHEASLATATSPQLANYQTVHFSTHGCINKDKPQLSGLALSAYNSEGEFQDPLLRLNNIYNLNLPAELVVLSACETGLGQELAGEGLVSLTRGFMYAGAKRVVVSFWAVQDLSTSKLMSKFYEKMYQDNLQPAAALRAAQLEMWRSDSAEKDPYHWAAFTVQGEW